jgi:hypothetical protein
VRPPGYEPGWEESVEVLGESEVAKVHTALPLRQIALLQHFFMVEADEQFFVYQGFWSDARAQHREISQNFCMRHVVKVFLSLEALFCLCDGWKMAGLARGRHP